MGSQDRGGGVEEVRPRCVNVSRCGEGTRSQDFGSEAGVQKAGIHSSIVEDFAEFLVRGCWGLKSG